MKINWGTGIAIAIIGFIGFIMYFVVTMSTDKAYSHDLVTEQYYQQELTYQKEIIALQNTNTIKNNIIVKKGDNGLQIHLPKEIDLKNIKGKVFLYRPSNKQLDFEIPISNSKPYLLVPEQRLVDGRWNIKIQWNYKNKEYLYKKELIY